MNYPPPEGAGGGSIVIPHVRCSVGDWGSSHYGRLL